MPLPSKHIVCMGVEKVREVGWPRKDCEKRNHYHVLVMGHVRECFRDTIRYHYEYLTLDSIGVNQCLHCECLLPIDNF